MDKVIARMNLYDILAMIVTGSIACMGIMMFDVSESCFWGNAIQRVITFYKGGTAMHQTIGIIFFLAMSYCIGIIIQVINVWLIKCLYSCWNATFINEYVKKINESRKELYDLFRKSKQIVDVEDRMTALKIDYYKAYNYAIIFNPQTAVLTLEKQIAFLRNLSIAILPVCLAIDYKNCCCNIMLWILIAVVLYIVTCFRMKKEVELVCEEYEAVKQLGLDKR